MRLSELLADTIRTESLPPEVSSLDAQGLNYDSRKVQPGDLFFAFAGARADGREFAIDAKNRGCVAVISEGQIPAGYDGPWITTNFARRTLALAARRMYPAVSEVSLVGITGTNGKTTTSYLIDSILRSAHRKTAVLGTIEYRIGNEIRPAANTTPESLDIYRLFNELHAMGGRQATMEVSSHALELGRVTGFSFHAGIFTNLTQDHLDFHGTMDHYFESKLKLFQGQDAPPPRHAIINFDDSWGRQIRVRPETQAWWYGTSAGSPIRAGNITSTFDGLRFDIWHDRGLLTIQSPLIGSINIYNILAACAVGLSYQLSDEVIEKGIADCRAIPGRFERVDEGQPFLVIVDYAHTPDALRNVIAGARVLNPKRIITLFGCGGDRDRAKRPLMAEAAASGSDYVVLTSDNPRSEDPLAIMTDAMVGLGRFDTPHHVEPDRAKAIRYALQSAEAGDIVILAGKGHETYQILKDQTIHFDDREVAREVLQGFGA